MSERIKCFFLTPSVKVKRFLRRYSSSEINPCVGGKFSFHNSKVLLDEVDIPVPGEGVYESDDRMNPTVEESQKPLFRPKCEACGYRFTDEDPYQIFTERLYYSDERDEYFTLRELPAGAMYYADWYLIENSNHFRGPDGHCLIVIVPGNHPWMVDGRASNCTLPDDNVHKCWVRHGEAPNITVDKSGVTCKAGAGSILAGSYHGFLRNGFLEQC